MDWGDDCYMDGDANHLPFSFVDELIPFLDKAALAEDGSTFAADFAFIDLYEAELQGKDDSAAAAASDFAFPVPLDEPAPWTSPPAGPLPTHEAVRVAAFQCPDVLSVPLSERPGSPQDLDDPELMFDADELVCSPPPDCYPVVHGERHVIYGPAEHVRIPAGEEELSDDDGSQLIQSEEGRADSQPEYKDYTRLSESSPERSSSSSSCRTDYLASSRGVTGKADVTEAASAPGTATSGSPAPSTLLTLGNAFHDCRIAATSIPSSVSRQLDGLAQPVSEASPPDGFLAVPLLKHQRIALSWMVQRETLDQACAGGILADDQGLGKTLSTIALIVSERPRQGEDAVDSASSDAGDDDSDWLSLSLACKKASRKSLAAGVSPSDTPMRNAARPAGGTLVVCPTSVLRQWADELQNKVTSKANLTFLVYHGPGRTRDPVELARYDVVLTTYHIVGTEFPKDEVGDRDDDVSDDKERLDAYDSLPRADAYPSASKKRKASPSAGNIGTRKATDQGNSAWPLATVAWFRVVLDEAQTIKNHQTLAARACSGLRAKRRWCLSGTPIQNSISDLYSYFRFLRYKSYEDYASFRDLIKRIEHNPDRGYSDLQAVLKKILLRRTKETQIEGQPIVDLPSKSVDMKALDFSEDERTFYNDLESQSREQFKEYQDAGTVRQNYVNILQLLLRLRQACNHAALVKTGCETSTPSASASPLLAETVEKLSRDKCLDLLKCLAASQAICTVCSDPPEDAVVSICGHVFCNQCVSEHLSGDDAEVKTCPKRNCRRKLNAATVFTRASLQICIGEVKLAPDTSAFPPAKQSEQKAAVTHADSSKIKATMEVLESLPKLENSSSGYDGHVAATEKALIFSQWTKMLDLLENKLRASGIQYKRLDGTMSIAERDRAVKKFNSSPEITVMLMSLKAASVGLNMVAANHVLLLDPWWNPTTEDQAIDRAHRIGQRRAVKVTRFTVKDTVEDRIMNLQAKKRRMVDSAFGEVGKGSRQSQLTVEDLSYLFKA